MRRRLAALAAATGSVATLAYALWDVDLAALRQSLRGLHVWVLGPFLAVLAAFYLINARRWVLMLRPFGCFRISQAAPAMMIGFAGNNVLPLRLGELVRTVVFAASTGQPRSGVLATLVAERLLDLVAILAVFALGLALLEGSQPAFQVSAWIAGAALTGLATAIAFLVGWPGQAGRFYSRMSKTLPDAIANRGAIYFAEFQRGFSFLRNLRLAVEVAALSLARWLLAVLLVWLSLAGYGEDISMALAMVVLGVTAFVVSLPSAPGFVGPIQAAFVFALMPFGQTQETALAASILFLIGHWLPVTALGAAYFLGHHLSYREIRSEAQAIADD